MWNKTAGKQKCSQPWFNHIFPFFVSCHFFGVLDLSTSLLLCYDCLHSFSWSVDGATTIQTHWFELHHTCYIISKVNHNFCYIISNVSQTSWTPPVRPLYSLGLLKYAYSHATCSCMFVILQYAYSCQFLALPLGSLLLLANLANAYANIQ